MQLEFTPAQRELKERVKAFVDDSIAPHAGLWDENEYIPETTFKALAQGGYFGAQLPKAYGGDELDMIAYGLLTEEIGRGCASVRNLLAVQGMVAACLLRCGSREIKAKWLPSLASGKIIAAFALTEPHNGSDAGQMQTSAVAIDGGYRLTGQKRWISFAQRADIFLLFALCEGKPTAFLIPRETAGLTVEPIRGMLGFRASMLGEIHLNECDIAAECLVGNVGLGFPIIASIGLHFGRYSTAWGAVGLAQAALESCLNYTKERIQFGVSLKDHQLIQAMITNMIAQTQAARLLSCQAGYLYTSGDPTVIIQTMIAKYFASTAAVAIASDAVQIHGANGCSSFYPVQRYMRDAKIMEIIEGSTQIQQIFIASSI